MNAYVDGLRHFCEAHTEVAVQMARQSGPGAASEYERDYIASTGWSRPNDPASLCTRMETALTSMVIEPIHMHLELRFELEQQLLKAAKVKSEERQVLLEEVQMVSESETTFMRGPLEALSLCQVDFMTRYAHCQPINGQRGALPSAR